MLTDDSCLFVKVTHELSLSSLRGIRRSIHETLFMQSARPRGEKL